MVNGKPESRLSPKRNPGVLPPNQPQPLQGRCAGQQRAAGAEGSKERKGELLLVPRVKLSNEEGKRLNTKGKTDLDSQNHVKVPGYPAKIPISQNPTKDTELSSPPILSHSDILTWPAGVLPGPPHPTPNCPPDSYLRFHRL